MTDRIDARLVDERDTQWEADRQDYRVFLVHDEDGWEVFDIDEQTFAVVDHWAKQMAFDRPGTRYSIAIRLVSQQGRGLLWLTADPDDPGAATGVDEDRPGTDAVARS
ncbi:hypothetical protein ACFWHT_09750 [Microbacterium sp. NPDC058342]|uniref:hypothetical protein n=1 Tax=Microbacterium sp. NPDC058342 TaxID=3346454 RepID=UPI003651FCE2